MATEKPNPSAGLLITQSPVVNYAYKPAYIGRLLKRFVMKDE